MSRLERERRVDPVLGKVVQCACCKEFWPEDPEFFFMKNGKAHSWCKACYRADPLVIAKNQRWQDRQRKNPPPPPPPAIDWSTLRAAVEPHRETA